MKFPESWLREHVSVDADSGALIKALTAIGLEVEQATPVGGSLEGVIVARIVECVPHPEADRLRICRVDAGQDELVQIVCGAPNARVGLVAPLATVGAELPDGMQIKPAKLRGIESFGMLCSAKELAIDADASGLMELPDDAPVGSALAGFLSLPDLAIEIKLTPNRADCFSVRGIAYDVAAALGASVKPMDVPVVPSQHETRSVVSSSQASACPRYLGRHVRGVDAKVATPLWMSERLKRSGIRPVSFLVDVTQYVMLELGQPMHAFDAELLRGEIGVRWSREGESVKLLDQREVTLDGGFLVITDQDRPVALAGIMGGWDSRVTDDTVNVFLEAAHFSPDAIVGRARKLGMHTDASHRFERGVDPALPAIAMERATALIMQIAGGSPGPICTTEHPEHIRQPAPVILRAARIRRVLGLDVASADVARILRALGMDVDAVEGGWSVVPPSRRFDVSIEEDLIEEVARIFGYEALPLTAPTGAVPPSSLPETQIPTFAVRQQLAARDYYEAINFAFLDQNVLTAWSLGGQAIPLANPLSAELGVMRPALLPGLVEALRRNRDRQQSRVRLFECGRVFSSGEGGPVETLRIAAVACGPSSGEQWSERARNVDFFDLKGDLESLAALAGQSHQLSFKASNEAWLHPGRSAEVWSGEVRLGVVGHLHPALLKSLDIDEEVVVFEVDLDPLRERLLPQAAELSRFPSVRRDLALVVPQATAWAELARAAGDCLGTLLTDVVLFDQYVGPGLEPGFKSLAMGLILQDVSRTLTDKEVEEKVAAVVRVLAERCQARLRG